MNVSGDAEPDAVPDAAPDAPAAAAVALLRRIAGESSAQMGSENFPVALRLLPRRVRDDLAAVYRFARFVDDVGDEAPGGPAARLALLDLVERDVLELEHGTPRLAPVADLTGVTHRHRVPVETYLDLIAANRQDQQRTRYATFADLLAYCELSAAPVGRIVLHVAGAAAPAAVAASDSVCAALQVLEHCQDVREDAERDRIYLPAEDLRAAGVAEAALRGAHTPPAVRDVVAVQVRRARELLAPGPALVAQLTGWARFAVAGYVAGGLATADALEAAHHDVLDRTIRPGTAATVRHALVLVAGRARSRT